MTKMIPTYPNDRDYFFDKDDNIYQVIGYVHPANYIYCLEKYSKIEDGRSDSSNFIWKSQLTNQYYKRNISMYSSRNATSNIKRHKYRKTSDLYGVDFIHFPRTKIKRYLNPIEKLEILRDQVQKSFLSLSDQERNAIEISYLFERELGIAPKNLGATGSILWEGVHPNSDIDIIIYGIQNMRRFFQGVNKLLQVNNKIRLPSVIDQMKWAGKFSQKSGLSVDDCTVFIANKNFLLYFSNFFLSIAFNPTMSEILQNTLSNDETKFRTILEFTSVTIQATVKEDDWMFFYPGVIYLKNVKIISPNVGISELPPICRAVVFEHENIGYYKKGSEIEIHGLVQVIQNPPQDVLTNTYSSFGETHTYGQIIVGTSENYGFEYIKNLGI
ncbi:MAG: hypothetical protein EU530_04915 [Promethearchaeota archaeon]|nr:MAG: hypothetical protein EU530_04915 [Candidatus Lokiarchaeota archaeon]